jgi:uncharacterized protein with HEPN domain
VQIRDHTARGEITDGLVFDAVPVRLIEIGEAIKDLPSELLATEPDIPWQDIARMRDQLAHRYFDTSHAIVAATVTKDLPLLEAAVGRWRSLSLDPDWGSRPDASDKKNFRRHTLVSSRPVPASSGPLPRGLPPPVRRGTAVMSAAGVMITGCATPARPGRNVDAGP